MKALAEHISTLRAREAPHRLAYVVEHEITQLLTRLFPKVGPAHPVEYGTFDNLAEALDWLGLPPDYKLQQPLDPGESEVEPVARTPESN